MLCALLLDGASIVLSKDAIVSGTAIELGEVATISGVEPGTIANLEAIDLGYSPSPGYTRLLFAERIAQNVALAYPGLEFTITGSPTCKVEPMTRTVEGSRIVQVAREALTTAARDARVTVSLLEAVPNIKVPAGTEEPTVRAALNADTVSTGVQTVTVRIEADGRPQATRQVQFRVQVWQTVDVLNRSVRAGDVITPDMIEQREVIVPGHQQGGALTRSMLVGAAAARNLEPGRALLEIDVHRPLAVEARASILVEVRSGAIRARAAAVAIQGGAIGERIRVRILDSEREMTAVIESRTLVVVDLGN